MSIVDINYLAVIAAGVASMVVGSLWYGPLFGRKWVALSGRRRAFKIRGAGELFLHRARKGFPSRIFPTSSNPVGNLKL